MSTSSPQVRLRRARDQRGAAAVEFALVSVVLFPLLFGILQYGLFFSDSLSVRQGVREAARAGVVKRFDATGCTGNDMAKLACRTKSQIGAVTGTTAVKIFVRGTGGWETRNMLVVCAMVKSDLEGPVPMPGANIITARTEMSIEVDDPVADSTSYTDTPLSGGSWSWCT